MPYNITKSNGVDIIVINDGVSDTGQLSIPLVGKNHQGYGEEIAQAFIHMLENFASDAEPANPTVGQLWYTPSSETLRVCVDDTDGAEVWYPLLTSVNENGGFGDIMPGDNLVYNIGSTLLQWNEIHANTFVGTATQARYADLAERYEADRSYQPGTVVMLGGEKEITQARGQGTLDVFGVISTAPGLMLNSEAGSDETHPYVALAGQVPVRVVGEVKKGQRLIASNISGCAEGISDEQLNSVNQLSIIGRALEDSDIKEEKLVKAVVGAK